MLANPMTIVVLYRVRMKELVVRGIQHKAVNAGGTSAREKKRSKRTYSSSGLLRTDISK